MEQIARRVPIDRTAAKVTSPGPKGVESSKRIVQAHSDVPLPTVPLPVNVKDLRGLQRGRLTVIGLAEPTASTRKQQGNNRLWVCRCVCSRYVTRRGKALNNERNQDDCCDHCRQVLYLRRRDTFRQLGYNPDSEA